MAILVILLLTYTNTLGIQYGKRVQNVFTVAKIGSLLGLIGLGIFSDGIAPRWRETSGIYGRRAGSRRSPRV